MLIDVIVQLAVGYLFGITVVLVSVASINLNLSRPYDIEEVIEEKPRRKPRKGLDEGDKERTNLELDDLNGERETLMLDED